MVLDDLQRETAIKSQDLGDSSGDDHEVIRFLETLTATQPMDAHASKEASGVAIPDSLGAPPDSLLTTLSTQGQAEGSAARRELYVPDLWVLPDAIERIMSGEAFHSEMEHSPEVRAYHLL